MEMLRLLAVGLVVPGLVSSVSLPSSYNQPSTKCRCVPGDACWPGDADWKAFNSTLGGKLIKTVPIGSVCHNNQDFATYDSAKCDNLRSVWNIPDTHIESASSVTAPFFANQSCDPFGGQDSQCILGTYVQYSVRATEASDYQKVVKFAKEKNIRLVIRNTAHDYLAKSSGGSSIAIWTHHLKNIEVLDHNSPTYKGKAIKVGAGVQFFEVYEKAKQNGLVVVGGNCDTVGIAGGYSQGGGTGTFASRYGLGADQTLEWEVVTADGRLVVASPTQNQDLYWALSGGGGGTYGVVLSLTIRAYPDKKTAAALLDFTPNEVSQDTFYNEVAAFVKEGLTLTKAGIVSTFLLTNATFSVAPILSHGMSKQEMDSLVQPTLDRLVKAGIKYNYVSKEFPTFLDAYKEMNPDTGVSIFQIGGRLISNAAIESSPESIASAFRKLNYNGAIVSGMSLNVANKPHPSNAVHPAWRGTGLSVVLGTLWDNTNWAQNLANQDLITNEFIPTLDTIPNRAAPAAYLNEADFRERNWQSVFYGGNYPALLRIKKFYDPSGLFWARTAVGSEMWVEGAGGKLCRAG